MTKTHRYVSSGLLASFLGGMALAAVLCFRFPRFLTTPQLVALYPLPLLRGAIDVALVVALALGAFAVAFRRQPRLGMFGLLCCATALAMGGGSVEAGELGEVTRSIGLDWLVIDLLLLGMIFIPLERLFPLDPGRPALRPGWSADMGHFFVSHLGIQGTLLLTTAPAVLFFGWAARPQLQGWVAGQPLWLQVIEVLVTVDTAQYFVHRALHQTRRLWPLHEIHHSSRQLDWLASSRLHFVDVVVTRAAGYLPVFVLGFAPTAIYLYTLFAAFHTILIHANLRFRLRWLEPFLVTPRYHHWHHAIEREAIDVNFAVHLPVLDWLFGTRYLPKEAWPNGYGVDGSRVPENYVGQALHPFRSRRAVQPE